MQRPSTLDNSQPVSHGFPPPPHTHARTHQRQRSHNIPDLLGAALGFLPWALGPQLDLGRLGGTWCETGQHPAAEPSRPPPPPPPPPFPLPLPYPPSLPSPPQHLQWRAGLWRAALRASPVTRRGGQAAGVTAHMSQHERGASRHACPLTFPTVGVQAERESKGGGGERKLCFLFDSLSATIWSARSLSHSCTAVLSRPTPPPRLSPGLSLIVAQTSVSFMI